jgi:hypothetical protein
VKKIQKVANHYGYFQKKFQHSPSKTRFFGNAAKIGFLHKLLSAPLARFQTSGRYCMSIHFWIDEHLGVQNLIQQNCNSHSLSYEVFQITEAYRSQNQSSIICQGNQSSSHSILEIFTSPRKILLLSTIIECYYLPTKM